MENEHHEQTQGPCEDGGLPEQEGRYAGESSQETEHIDAAESDLADAGPPPPSLVEQIDSVDEAKDAEPAEAVIADHIDGGPPPHSLVVQIDGLDGGQEQEPADTITTDLLDGGPPPPSLMEAVGED